MDTQKLAERKSLRLKHFDYCQDGLYFITICTAGKLSLFGRIRNDTMHLSDSGSMIEKHLFSLTNKYPTASIIKSVVMPNHVHLLIQIESAERQNAASGAIPQIIQWLKTRTTCDYIKGVKRLGYEPFHQKLWQRSYYDHIVRSDNDFERIWTYIDQNVIKWSSDEYFYDNETSKDPGAHSAHKAGIGTPLQRQRATVL